MTPRTAAPAQAGRGHAALRLQPFDLSRDIPSGVLDLDLPTGSERGRAVAVRASPGARHKDWAAHAAVADRGALGLPRSTRAGRRPVFRRAPSASGVQHRESRGHHRRHRVRRLPSGESSAPPTPGGSGWRRRGLSWRARTACSTGPRGIVSWLPWSRAASWVVTCQVAESPFHPPRHTFDRARLQGRAHGGAGQGRAHGCHRSAGSRAKGYIGHDCDREGREPASAGRPTGIRFGMDSVTTRRPRNPPWSKWSRRNPLAAKRSRSNPPWPKRSRLRRLRLRRAPGPGKARGPGPPPEAGVGASASRRSQYSSCSRR